MSVMKREALFGNAYPGSILFRVALAFIRYD
jgi:hypothetical protein